MAKRDPILTFNMDESISEYQEDLKIREKKLKTIVHFEPDEEVEQLLKELKDKQITL